MKKRERVTGKEQYYTSDKTVDACLDFLLDRFNMGGDQLFLEPSGGTGTFINHLKERGYHNIVSYDIEPKHPDVIKVDDFITTNIDHLKGAISLGNPPFGRNNSLSVPFFNHCAGVSDLIAFIIPASWGKWSIQRRLDKNFHLVDLLDLKPDYVDDKGKPMESSGILKTSFQVWEKRDTPRVDPLKNINYNGLIIKTDPQDADIALTTHGHSCGRVETEFKRVPNTTKMFLKVQDDTVVSDLEGLDYDRFSTRVAYTKALSFPEIVYLLNEKRGLL